jgi:hypothetical protein
MIFPLIFQAQQMEFVFEATSNGYKLIKKDKMFLIKN